MLVLTIPLPPFDLNIRYGSQSQVFWFGLGFQAVQAFGLHLRCVSCRCVWIHDYKWHFLLGLSSSKLPFPITLYHSHSCLESSTTGALRHLPMSFYSSQYPNANDPFVQQHNMLVTCLPPWERYYMYLGNKVTKVANNSLPSLSTWCWGAC